eukprot:gb/GECG01013026.1/.p1 GENE.gb/GECG01013026.1/~~gb/GECG01013026.1/.p1  ORF type:complete len:679 (+),score=84.32 gb/GECG01013026.1/:1-2037(+)
MMIPNTPIHELDESQGCVFTKEEKEDLLQPYSCYQYPEEAQQGSRSRPSSSQYQDSLSWQAPESDDPSHHGSSNTQDYADNKAASSTTASVDGEDEQELGSSNDEDEDTHVWERDQLHQLEDDPVAPSRYMYAPLSPKRRKARTQQQQRQMDAPSTVSLKSAALDTEEEIAEMERVVHEVQQEEIERMTRLDESDNVVEPNWFAALTTYMSYAVLMLFGYIRDFFGRLTGSSRYFSDTKQNQETTMLKDWENFFTRRMYHRIQDCWNRPIGGAPTSSTLKVLNRSSDDGNCTLKCDGTHSECINLGSYNYLGFADDWEELCKEPVMSTLNKFNSSCCSSSCDAGYTTVHRKLEKMIAKFVGKPAAIVFNTGYGTNISTIPALMGGGTLVISDSLNHTSIVNGSRSSPATIRVFRHNDMKNLERMIQSAIVEGQPRTGLRWRKIVVLVEGVYSMEGEILNLPEVLRICKKYKVYLYVDEAHSIGALGAHGRGVCEHWNIDPTHVDVLMGTFTKSFGGMGGYVAASKEFISYLSQQTSGNVYTNSIPPPVCQQIISALRVISGTDGSNAGAQKLQTVKRNANYLRAQLIRMGTAVLGDWDSPVVPVLIFHPSKVAAFSRELIQRGLAVVVVGFPATQLTLARSRFCVSAGHSKKDLDYALSLIDHTSDLLKVKYNSRTFG